MKQSQPVTKPNHDHHCGAKTRAGTPCKLAAGQGTAHPGIGRCRRHGGSTPRGQIAGVVELARRDAHAMGTPLAIHPSEALLECVQIAAGEVQFASEQIARLDPNELIGAPVTRTEATWGDGDNGGGRSEQKWGPPTLHVWIKVRQHAMDRLVKYSQVAIACGIAERHVQLAERQGQLIAQVIRGVLVEMGVMDRDDTATIVRKHLALITAGTDVAAS